MPAKVANVDWRCTHCGKRQWLKPAMAGRKKYCSRPCLYAAQHVEHPVREKPGQKLARYGTRQCGQCGTEFEAKHQSQLLCSQACSLAKAQDQARRHNVEPRPCATCGAEFTPRPKSAGRFCSRSCTYKGQQGEQSPHWKGGRAMHQAGYVMVSVRDHPYAQKHHGYVPEHRLVMEQQLRRYLAPDETVHHINGQRDDNRPENLQLRQGRHGKGAAFVCLDCGSHNVVSTKISEQAEP
jgi:hypothetical protein